MWGLVVLSTSILVACALCSVGALACAVIAWSNGQPRVVRALRDQMTALEADRVEWLQRMSSFADAARHDLEQSEVYNRKAQNRENRSKRQEPNAVPTPSFGDDDAGLAAVEQYWAGR